MATLHLTRTIHALTPNYVSRFRCIGAECKDNCCTGWHIGLDKKTFNSYRQSKHPELRAAFDKGLRREPSENGDRLYGRIALSDKDGTCPLMQGGLCGVQKHMDESHLSNTCFTYPRVSADFGGQMQQALQLSCPEAARLALLAPDAFEFTETTVAVRPDDLVVARPREGFPEQLMHDVRIFCLQLMRSQGLELWQRLAMLGVFCERLTALERDSAAAARLIDSFTSLLESGSALDALQGLQPDHEAQALVFATIWGGLAGPAGTAHERAVLASVAANLGADPHTGNAPVADLLAAYATGVRRLPLALEAAPHLLDHYILNEMFTHLFPFGRGSAYDSYLELVSRFGLLRMMLAARCASEGPLPDADALVETVQVFYRRFRHNTGFARRVNDALKNSGWNSLDKLYGFLRH